MARGGRRPPLSPRRTLHRGRRSLQPADRSLDDRAQRGAHPPLARPWRPALRARPEAPQDAGHLADLRELLDYLARLLVDHPDKVQVEEYEEDDGTLVLELSVDEDDYGQVIGRGGRTAQALRTVVKAAAVKDNRRVLVDIVE